ncbi:MAG: hypothetical protein WA956_15425 [Stenotrophomonas sp.]
MEVSHDSNPIIKKLARSISKEEMLSVSGGVSTIVKREYSVADGGLDENTYGKNGKYEGKDTVEKT